MLKLEVDGPLSLSIFLALESLGSSDSVSLTEPAAAAGTEQLLSECVLNVQKGAE